MLTLSPFNISEILTIEDGGVRHFENSTKPEVGFSGQTVADKSIYCIKVEREVGTASSFMACAFRDISTSGLFSPVMRV